MPLPVQFVRDGLQRLPAAGLDVVERLADVGHVRALREWRVHKHAVDRLSWLYEHRKLVGGRQFIEAPLVLRFFTGRLTALDPWSTRLADAFCADFGDAV